MFGKKSTEQRNKIKFYVKTFNRNVKQLELDKLLPFTILISAQQLTKDSFRLELLIKFCNTLRKVP